MAVCVFSGIGLDKFVDSDETKFYKVNHEYMSVDKFLSTSSISKEKIERLREKLYPKIEPKKVEEKQDIVTTKKPINIPVYPKKTFEEMLRDIDMNRRRSNLLRRRKNISTWYVKYKHDIDEMFFGAYNQFDNLGIIFTDDIQRMYNHFIEHLYDKYA